MLGSGEFMRAIQSTAKIVLGLACTLVGVVVMVTILLLLLPFRTTRIKACNYFGKIYGPLMMWVSGCPVTIEGREHLDGARPAIYACNHTSILDIFLAVFLSPVGTVGIAKKSVIYYPFFGILYLLSGHLRIDRSDRRRAVASLRELAGLVRTRGLSINIWPEGTRARDGHLLPLKKGIVHLALQTGLPIVPIVVSGAHKSWAKGSLSVKRTDIHVRVLPPVETSGWSAEAMEDHLRQLHATYAAALPGDQQPMVPQVEAA